MKFLPKYTLGDTVMITVVTIVLSLACTLTVFGFWVAVLIVGCFIPAVLEAGKSHPGFDYTPILLLRTVALAVLLSAVIATAMNPLWQDVGFLRRYLRTFGIAESALFLSFGVSWLIRRVCFR